MEHALVIGNCDNLTLDATGAMVMEVEIGFAYPNTYWTASSNEGDDSGSDTTVSTISSLYLDALNSTATTVEIPGLYFNTSLTYYFKN